MANILVALSNLRNSFSFLIKHALNAIYEFQKYIFAASYESLNYSRSLQSFYIPLTCQSFELICGKHFRGGFIHCEGQKTQKLMIDHFYNKEDQLVRKMPYGVIELIFVLPNGIMFHT